MLIFRPISHTPSADVALPTAPPQAVLRSRIDWYTAGLAGSLALALGLRVSGLTWGFPHRFHIDEDFVLSVTESLIERFSATGSLKPEVTSYGALPLYLLALASTLASQVISAAQTIVPLPIHSAPPLYVARLLSALEGLATVWLTAELARRLFGRSVALLTALFLGVCLLPVREAHFGTVDTLLVALISLTLLSGEQIARRGARTDYVNAGVTLALAASTKVVGLLLLAPLVVAHVYHRAQRAESSPVSARTQGGLAGLVWMMIVAGAVWLALNPYILLDPDIYLDLDRNSSLRTQGLVVQGQLPVLYTLQFANVIPYLYVITNLLRWGMGLPLEILALCGITYGLWRVLSSARARHASEGKWPAAVFADVFLLSWLLAYFVVLGSSYAQFIRYALPLTPVLCLLSSRLLVDLCRSPSRAVRALGIAAAAGVFASSLIYTLGYLAMYQKPDVRVTASAWLKRHVPAESSILVEKDETLFLHRNDYRKAYGLSEYPYRWQLWNPYEVDGVKSVRYQAPSVSEERTRAHLAALLTADYIVVGSMWRERFLAAPALFPAQAEFYQRLFNGDAGYRLMRTFRVQPKLGLWVWSEDDSELTFRLFDHPTVFVFARNPQAPVARDRTGYDA
jgi:hypothetical protein